MEMKPLLLKENNRAIEQHAAMEKARRRSFLIR